MYRIASSVMTVSLHYMLSRLDFLSLNSTDFRGLGRCYTPSESVRGHAHTQQLSRLPKDATTRDDAL